MDYSLTPAEVPAAILALLIGRELPETFDVYSIRQQDQALLRKLVFYDTPNPTGRPVPTEEQMREVTALPQLDKPALFSRCRIFAQDLLPTVANSATILQVWVDRSQLDETHFLNRLSVKVRILCHYGVETYGSPTGVYSRSMGIAHLVQVLLDDRHLPGAGVGPMKVTELQRVSDNRERAGYELTVQVVL